MMIYNKRTKEDGAHEVRGTSALRRPERSGDHEPWVQGTLRDKKRTTTLRMVVLFSLQKMGLEPTRVLPH